ncbi:hypothetical protein HK102_005191 [Quaeritorhiza haematococci]|nr:hypothetical protein HK102_005191 [Quaeritorhiza haematococci]
MDVGGDSAKDDDPYANLDETEDFIDDPPTAPPHTPSPSAMHVLLEKADEDLRAKLAELGEDPSETRTHAEAMQRGHHIFIAVYVDDLFIVGRPDDISGIKLELSKRFRMMDSRRLSYVLGVKFAWNAKSQ